MMKSALVAASLGTGLVVPPQAGLHVPTRPEVIRTDGLAPGEHLLPAMPLTLGLVGVRARPQLSLSNVSVYGTSTQASSYSPTMDLGPIPPAGSTRYIIVATQGCVNSTLGNVNSVSIGGNAATLLYRPYTSMGRPTELWYIQNNTLTSGVVSVNLSSQQYAYGMSVWNLINPASITPHFTNYINQSASVNTLSITVPANGVGMCLDSTNIGSGTHTWTNAMELFDQQTRSGMYISGAQTTAFGTFDVTCTQQGTGAHTTVVASWAAQ